MASLTQEAIAAHILACLRQELDRRHPGQATAIGLETALVGPGAVLDSLGLVTFAVSLEQRLNDAASVNLNVADEQELTRRNSPFRTVGTLTQHLRSLIGATDLA